MRDVKERGKGLGGFIYEEGAGFVAKALEWDKGVRFLALPQIPRVTLAVT